MKVLTFLGADRAHDTVYKFDDGTLSNAMFFGVALAERYPGCQLIVFVTEKAEATHGAEFDRLAYAHGCQPSHVPIPDGRSEADLWDIFQIVVDQVGKEESVVFDITHGFRSLPFLSFLAAAYLRVVKSVRLEAVLFGNFQMRDSSGAPVIDLTPFVTLLDWTTAARRFMQFGDAQEMARLLQDTLPSSERLAAEPELRPAAKAMRGATDALSGVSRALRLIRPDAAMHAAAGLEASLKAALPFFAQRSRPLLPLTNDIVNGYRKMALSKTEAIAAPVAGLHYERNLVGWYVDKRQYAQAVAVAREWLVTWVLLWIGETDLLDKERREAAEYALNAVARQKRSSSTQGQQEQRRDPTPLQQHFLTYLSALAHAENAAKLYENIGDLRNDLLHAGKRRNARKTETLERDIIAMPGLLEGLPLPDVGIAVALENE